jgi:hypothetical protein
LGFEVANLRRNLVLLSLIPTSDISWGEYSLSKSLSLSITWTADVDSTIVRMRTDGDSFAKIASELGDGLKDSDIKKQVDSSPERQRKRYNNKTNNHNIIDVRWDGVYPNYGQLASLQLSRALHL